MQGSATLDEFKAKKDETMKEFDLRLLELANTKFKYTVKDVMRLLVNAEKNRKLSKPTIDEICHKYNYQTPKEIDLAINKIDGCKSYFQNNSDVSKQESNKKENNKEDNLNCDLLEINNQNNSIVKEKDNKKDDKESCYI